jgi:hypothetical protein
MVLPQDEAISFFKMYLPLLHYAYATKHNVTFLGFKSIEIKEKMKAQNMLFQKPHLLEEYLFEKKLNGRAEEDIREIKKHVTSNFIILKNLSKYSVFMDMKNGDKLYGVIGITDELVDILPFFPIIIHGVIFPFRKKLVCSGLFCNENVQFGPGIRRDLNEKYKEQKAMYGIALSF